MGSPGPVPRIDTYQISDYSLVRSRQRVDSDGFDRPGHDTDGSGAMQRLEIWAATATPFDAHGELALDVVKAQAQHLSENDVDGVFVAGTSGEFPALSVEERESLLDTWAAHRPEGLRLGVHVGHLDLRQARRLAANAEKLGVDMIASVAPFYGSSRVEPTVRWLAEVAAAAPRTPFCFYHIPAMTGSSVRPSELVARAVREIPTLAYVKFTDNDMLEFDETRAAAPQVRVFFGRDELLPAALAFGAEGVIGSLYNALAPVARAVAAASAQGRHAMALDLHRVFREIARTADQHGGPGFVKELLNRIGPDAGVSRSPWGPLHPAGRAAVADLVPLVQRAVSSARTQVPDPQ
jgi:N-acetylneuraminate lyase